MPIHLIDLMPVGVDEEIGLSRSKRTNDIVLTVTTPFGERRLDSPYDPKGEAQKLADQARGAGAVVLLGCGAGYVAHALMSEPALKQALIVTGSAAAASHTVKQLEKLDPLDAEVTVVTASRADDAWDEAVRGFVREHPEAALLIHPREWNAFPGLHGALAVRIRACGRRLGLQPSPQPRKVLLFATDGLMEPELEQALRAEGIEVVVEPPLTRKSLTADDALDFLETHRPDLVLSTNNQGSDTRGLLPEACDTLGIPWATWFLDDPRFILTPEEQDAIGRERWGFHWDANGEAGWRDMGFERSAALPLATDETRFYPREGDPALAGRVVFVGSPLFQRAPGYFASLAQDPVAEDVAEALREEILLNRCAPSLITVKRLLRELGEEGHFAAESLRRLPAFAVQMANRRYRADMLAALASLKPVVFGSGWEGLLPPDIELRGTIDYNRDLPALYSCDAVHLSLTNLQMRTCPNQRIFDAGACGGVVVQERLDDMGELFGDDVDTLLFSGLQELKEKLAWLAGDGAARKHYGERLRELVLEKHTVRHRVRSILQIIVTGANSGS